MLIALSEDQSTSYALHHGRIPFEVVIGDGNGTWWMSIQTGPKLLTIPSSWKTAEEAIDAAELFEYQRLMGRPIHV